MTQPMLTNMADVLRSVGCTVEELPDWKLTSRSNDTSRYVSGRPTHFMHHHTATRTAAHSVHSLCRLEAKQLQLAEPNEPTSNLGLCTHGVWFCICAGPSNTNGVGVDTWHPVGDRLKVPDNSMNSFALANEMLNNGVNERYSDDLLNALLNGTAALCRAYNIGVFENRAHFEWAPTRKIDPAGPCRYARLTDPNLKWDMGLFRTDLLEEIKRQSLPNLPPLGDNMKNIVLRCNESPTFVAWDGTVAIPLEGGNSWNIGKFVGLYPNEPMPPVIAKQDLQAIITNFTPPDKRITL